MQIDVLTFERVGKSFFGAAALREVSFALGSGRVLGLVGENGAGKSTLMNILGGVLQADAGRMLLAGAPYAPRSAADATAAGVAMVHQELNLFTNLSIAENLLLDDLPRRGPTGLRWIDYRALRRRAPSCCGLWNSIAIRTHRSDGSRPASASWSRSPGPCAARRADRGVRRADHVAHTSRSRAIV